MQNTFYNGAKHNLNIVRNEPLYAEILILWMKIRGERYGLKALRHRAEVLLTTVTKQFYGKFSGFDE